MIVLTNARLHAILDSDDATTITTLFGDLVPEDEPLLEQAIAAVLADRPVADLELTVDKSPPRVVSLSLRTLTDTDGQVIGAIGCVNDVTDRVSSGDNSSCGRRSTS